MGRESAFVQKYPEYGRPRFCLGRWERDWGYRCVLTLPQIEIMQAELPHTLYNFKDNRPDDECERLNREALEKARARHRKKAAASGPRAYTLEEVFSGAADEE